MIRRPPRSTQSRSSAASDVYKRHEPRVPHPAADPARLDPSNNGVIPMKRRSSIAIAAFAATAALTLTACGGGDSDGGGGDGATTLTLLSWEGEATMTPVVEAFEAENPDITLEVSYSPPVAEYIQTLQTRVLSGTCLLYTSDAADDLLCVDLGGRRIIK